MARSKNRPSADNDSFFGEITVASRIVDQLSSGLYESPAACLKELINNSFDADATQVDVLIKPDADRIIIDDNGLGMTKADFLKHFSRISESYKREHGDKTPRGRKKIGKIGIGFIAANEICDTMELRSTTRGSTELLVVQIHFDLMRQDPAVRRRQSGLAKADYSGRIEAADRNAQFTQLVLKRVRPTAKQLFAGETNLSKEANPRTLYGKDVEGVEAALSDETLNSWLEFDSYSQNLLRVALNVPVPYHTNWMPKPGRRIVAGFERRTRALNFQVSYDGTELRKPIVFLPPAGKGVLVRPFSFAGRHVSADGYFYVQHGIVRPHDLHGVLLRIRNAAIGGYDPSFFDFPPSEGSLIQRWVSAELWADDRLEDALNIDRKTLRVSHPAFIELQKAVHDRLTEIIADAREELYEAGSEVRRIRKAESQIETIRDVAESSLRAISPSAATEVVRRWSRAATRRSSLNKPLLRKYTVGEFYEVVVEVARDVLTPSQAARFIRALTDRLSR